MPERQSHGFIFEQTIIDEYGYQKASGYTDKWDCFTNEGKPIQIKLIKKGSSIDLGDIFRNADVDFNFKLIVGFWEGKKDNVVDVYFIDVDYTKWLELFKFDYYDELNDWIKNKVSNSYDYDNQWKKECKHYKTLWGRKRIVQPRFKRDHKKQRRIQSGISYKNFINKIVKEGVINE